MTCLRLPLIFSIALASLAACGGSNSAAAAKDGGAAGKSGSNGGSGTGGGTSGSSGNNGKGTANDGGTAGAAIAGRGAVVVIKRFATDGQTVYFWADLELEVTAVNDPTDHQVISTVGKEPGFVPFASVKPGVLYDVKAHGGSVKTWNGFVFVDSGSGGLASADSDTKVVAKEGEVLGIGTGITVGVALRDTWSPLLDGGDRWYCTVNQLPCGCSWKKGNRDSWPACPPIPYRCCWENKDGSTCECQAPGTTDVYMCDQQIAMTGGRSVSACPARAVPPGAGGKPDAGAAGQCNDLNVTAAPLISPVTAAVGETAPQPMGGEIMSGTYQVTAEKTYGGSTCTAPTSQESGTYAFTASSATAGTLQAASSTGGGKVSGTYTTSGTAVMLTVTCPTAADAGQPQSHPEPYTATATELLIFNTGSCTTVTTYTKQ